MKFSASYDASKIEFLEGIEPVRKRPAMYIGTCDREGLHRAAFEPLESSADWALDRSVRRIEVEILGERTVRIADDGPGLSGQIDPRFHLSMLEAAFTRLHRDFCPRARVGLAVANALCERLDVESRHGGIAWLARFERGRTAASPWRGGSADASGLSLVLRLDDRIFPTSSGGLDAERFRVRARELCALVPGLVVTVADRRTAPPRENVFGPDRGVEALLPLLTDMPLLVRALVARRVFLTDEGPGHLEVAIQFRPGKTRRLLGFVNLDRVDSGSHLFGLQRGVVRGMRSLGRRPPRGLVACGSVILPDARLAGSCRNRLISPPTEAAAEHAVAEAIRRWAAERPDVFDRTLPVT